MGIEIKREDLTIYEPDMPEDQATAMITGAIARAVIIAPCLKADDLDVGVAAAAKDILIQVILRRYERITGGGGLARTQTAGPYGMTVDTRTPLPLSTFLPTEITDLQGLCKMASSNQPRYSFPEPAQPDPFR